MLGRWKVNIKGRPEDGGSYGLLTCSNCNRTFPTTQLPEEKDGTFKNPNFCPECGADMREHENLTRAEIVMHNMSKLLDNYQCRTEPDEVWWEDYCGGDLTDMIGCNIGFKGSRSCLVSERQIEYLPPGREKMKNEQEACAECKAAWLMEVYE